MKTSVNAAARIMTYVSLSANVLVLVPVCVLLCVSLFTKSSQSKDTSFQTENNALQPQDTTFQTVGNASQTVGNASQTVGNASQTTDNIFQTADKSFQTAGKITDQAWTKIRRSRAPHSDGRVFVHLARVGSVAVQTRSDGRVGVAPCADPLQSCDSIPCRHRVEPSC
jgi:hypothetical protein